MLILADNDVGGAIAVLRRILELAAWADIAAPLSLRFLQLPDLDLPRDESDAEVWHASQKNDAVLITANRASGDDALGQVIHNSGDSQPLPVITLADPQRIRRDRDYAEEYVFSLLDLLERLEGVRGDRTTINPLSCHSQAHQTFSDRYEHGSRPMIQS